MYSVDRLKRVSDASEERTGPIVRIEEKRLSRYRD
jgi:hypothetical protein